MIKKAFREDLPSAPWNAVSIKPPPPNSYLSTIPDIQSLTHSTPDHHLKSKILLEALEYRYNLVVPPEVRALR